MSTETTQATPEAPQMAEALAPLREALQESAEPRKCRAVKHGGIPLHCTEDEGHDEGPEATWHRAVYTRHEEHAYDGARHVVDHAETVTWEPVDHAAEATRHLMAGRGD